MRAGLLTAALSVSACATTPPDPAPEPGPLVIVGGGLSDDNAQVWRAFTDAAGADGTVFVIPAASGYPSESAGSSRAAMARHGLPETRTRTAPLAVIDDPTTPDLDESAWGDGASDIALAADLRDAAGIWFTGGDQRRITALLLGTPALDAIREAHENGAVIGGTSAGAAVMSDPMITGGFRDGSESEPLTHGRGLGFIEDAVIDQHFTERNRLWRLQEMQTHAPGHVGLGIDEDTALLFDGYTATVLGRGTVTVVDSPDNVWVAPPGLVIEVVPDEIELVGEVSES